MDEVDAVRVSVTCHQASEVDRPLCLGECGNSMVGVFGYVVIVRVDDEGRNR